MFRPSTGHLQGARLILSQPDQQNIYQMYNSELYCFHKLNFTFVTFFVDLAVKMLPEDGPLRVETCCHNSANKVVLIT